MEKFPLDFIGIGVDRGATYWITEILKEHPEIQFSKQKEIGFFNEYDQHFLTVKNPRYQRGITWYSTFFPERESGKKMGEYTPTYIFSPKAAARIKKHFPDVKLICTLRDPVKRAFSQYIHDLSIGLISKMTFEETIEKHKAYVEKGYYYKHLKPYLKLFKKNQIHLVLVDNIKKNPEKEVKNIYKFLELNDINFKPKAAHEKTNPASISRFPFLNKFLISGEVFLISKRFEFIHKFLEDTGIRKFIFWLTYTLNRKHISQNEYPKINKNIEARLRKSYLSDIQKLEKLTGFNLRKWK